MIARLIRPVGRRVAAMLRALDRHLCTCRIPVEQFGWVTLGYDEVDPSLGAPSAYGIWTTGKAEREYFYAHNRRVTALAAKLRRWAWTLSA